jgi:hypothetical protein
MKKMFLSADQAFEECDQDCSKELSTLLRALNGGRSIHDPQDWI